MNVPAEIEHKLYEGNLTLAEPGDQRGDQETERSLAYKTLNGESPHLTIGEPEVLNISELLRTQGKAIPAATKVQLQDAGFFVVRLACSFRGGKNVRIEWARFSVSLTSEVAATSPAVAYDLHPLELYKSGLRNVKVGLTPALNFREIDEIEASLGEYVYTFNYPQLVPVLTAAGIQESEFSWDLRETKAYPVSGPRWFHALIKKPRAIPGLLINFNVNADVLTPVKVFRFKLTKAERAQMTRLICKEAVV